MKIEDIITENRDRFEADTLPDGYLANFEKRLVRPRCRLQLSFAISTLAAAVVALVLLLNPAAKLTVDAEDVQMSKEVAEMQAYYEGQQERTIAIIETLLEKVDPQTRAEIKTELMAMQYEDTEFKNRYRPKLPAEQYIAYEVEHYQTRQQSLDYIITILQK